MNQGKGRSFKFGENLKAHYSCEQCDYSTHSKDYYKTHNVKHHGEQPDKEYICNDCDKTFDCQLLLKRHQRHGMCTTLKNFICQIGVPTKGCKSHLSLVIHIKRFHTGEIPLVPCPKCKKAFASEESLKAHNIIHLGLELLKKAKSSRLRMEQNLAAKKFATGKPGKSAPAKLIPSKSPRAKPRKTNI